MISERRKELRFPVVHNVGEPIVLQVSHHHRDLTIPGFILDISSGGMKIVTLGNQISQLHCGSRFVLDLKLPKLNSRNVEGKIVRIEKAKHAKMHHTDEEWFLGLQFTKLKSSDAHLINRMAEDWSICETKMEMGLMDVCFKDCAYWNLCEKSIKVADL